MKKLVLSTALASMFALCANAQILVDFVRADNGWQDPIAWNNTDSLGFNPEAGGQDIRIGQRGSSYYEGILQIDWADGSGLMGNLNDTNQMTLVDNRTPAGLVMDMTITSGTPDAKLAVEWGGDYVGIWPGPVTGTMSFQQAITPDEAIHYVFNQDIWVHHVVARPWNGILDEGPGGTTAKIGIGATDYLFPITVAAPIMQLGGGARGTGVLLPAGQTLTLGTDVGGWALDAMMIEVVPEPATIGLMGIAGLGLFIRRRMRG